MKNKSRIKKRRGRPTLEEKPVTRNFDWARRVREIRFQAGISQQEFANSLGISNTYLCGIEKATRKPAPDFFIRLANVYGISLDYLLLGSGPVKLEEKTTKTEPDAKNINNLRTVEDLFLLMKYSTLFNYTIMGYASRFFLENEDIIKRSIKTPATDTEPGDEPAS